MAMHGSNTSPPQKSSQLKTHNRYSSETVNSPRSSSKEEANIAQNASAAYKPPVATQTGGNDNVAVEGEEIEAAEQSQRLGPAYSVFNRRQKQFIIFMAAWGGLFSSLSANIYFPALNVLSRELKVSPQLISLTLTSYMIFQGLAPTLYGDLADMAGRRPVFAIGMIIYLGANIGLALQNEYAALFLLRCLQSSGSSGTIALGNAVIADISPSAERGTYMGLVSSGPMLGPAIGPILGGILSQFLGWRAIFWFLTILAAMYLIPFLVAFPETGRNLVANGSIRPQGWNMSLVNYFEIRKTDHALKKTASMQEKDGYRAEPLVQRQMRIPNPLRTIRIVMEKDVGLVLFYNAIVYTAFYGVTTSLPSLFEKIYHFNSLQIGLSFIPYGIGCTIVSVGSGKLMDYNYYRVAQAANIPIDCKRGDDLRRYPIEKARIQVAWPLVYVGSATLLCYGWVLEKQVHLAAPLVMLFVMGICLTGVFDILNTLLIDLYPESPATATAANNLVRCFMGAAGTAVILPMINAMGRGWCFTFIAAVVLLTSPLLWVVTKWGPKWREERRARE